MAEADHPGEAVANTPELLEDILLRIDMRTLLLSQRVNKTFEATIAGSAKLRQKLFMHPIPANTKFLCTELQCRDITCDNYFNPLANSMPRSPPLRPHGHANPLFDKNVYLHTNEKRCYYHNDAYFRVSGTNSWPHMNLGPRSGAKKDLVRASWRKMFAHQPFVPMTLITQRPVVGPSA